VGTYLYTHERINAIFFMQDKLCSVDNDIEQAIKNKKKITNYE